MGLQQSSSITNHKDTENIYLIGLKLRLHRKNKNFLVIAYIGYLYYVCVCDGKNIVRNGREGKPTVAYMKVIEDDSSYSSHCFLKSFRVIT